MASTMARASVIVLREIPNDVNTEELRDVFNFSGAKPVTDLTRDADGVTWYATMESDEAAKDMCLDLRLKQRTLRGQSLKARVKHEARAPANASGVPSIFSGQAIVNNGFPDVRIPSGAPSPNMHAGSFESPIPQKNGSPRDAKAKRDKRGSSRPVADATGDAARTRRHAGGERTVRKEAATGKDKKSSTTKTDKVVEKVQPPTDLSTASFPPLAVASVDDTPLPMPGYQGPYQKYTNDEIISIVRSVEATNLPAAVAPELHPIALVAEANLDLLKRQRTYSIDETRDQLRQGRPVQREAVISGAVDYNSLMYGDLTRSRSGTGSSQTEFRMSPSSWAALVKSVDNVSKSPTPTVVTTAPVKVAVVTPAASPAVEKKSTATVAPKIESKPATTSAWGSKSSFASILKQNLDH